MRPLDPRLLRHAAASRSFLVLAAFLGLGQVALVIVFSWLLASILARAAGWVGIIGEVPGAGSSALLPELTPALVGLAAVVAGRAVLAWAVEFAAARAAVKAKSQLRQRAAQALAETVAAGHPSPRSRDSAHAVTVLGSGLDALDSYFSRYLPQLVLTALAIPLHLAVLATQDLTTAVVVALTLPLIPLFMALIGFSTQTAQQRQWRRLDRLSRTYLDLVEGLSTLKVFNRAHRQQENLRAISEQHRTSTMKVLRVSFLSGFVLELAASLSVALVAVSVGIRLIDGQLDLAVGLFVLLIVPEAYAPLRQVGANYHAAAEGVAAAEDVFEILDAAPESPRRPAQQVSPAQRVSAAQHASPAQQASPAQAAQRGVARDLVVTGLRVDRDGARVIDGLDLRARSGELTVISGPSGVGKSSLFAAVMGFLPFSGEVQLQPLTSAGAASQSSEVEPPGLESSGLPLTGPERRGLIAWTGQRHGLRSGSVLENITLGDDSAAARAEEVSAEEVLAELGLSAEDARLPSTRNSVRLDQRLGVRGAGLSGGQAHRVAVARALYRARSQDCPVLLLDEPSAALDAASEARLVRTLRGEAAAGRTVVVISHHPAMREAADHLVELSNVEAGAAA